jgi:hypothetical protein
MQTRRERRAEDFQAQTAMDDFLFHPMPTGIPQSASS